MVAVVVAAAAVGLGAPEVRLLHRSARGVNPQDNTTNRMYEGPERDHCRVKGRGRERDEREIERSRERGRERDGGKQRGRGGAERERNRGGAGGEERATVKQRKHEIEIKRCIH